MTAGKSQAPELPVGAKVQTAQWEGSHQMHDRKEMLKTSTEQGGQIAGVSGMCGRMSSAAAKTIEASHKWGDVEEL